MTSIPQIVDREGIIGTCALSNHKSGNLIGTVLKANVAGDAVPA